MLSMLQEHRFKDFSEAIRTFFFQNSSFWVIAGRGFLTPPMFSRPPYIASPPYSNFVQPLYLLFTTFNTLLFSIFRFFDWMGDRATFDVLFHLMLLWTYKCWALVPKYQKDLANCFTHIDTKIHGTLWDQ